jgi:hypothetical protein
LLVQLPILSLTELVYAGRNVPSNGSKQRIGHNDGHQELTLVHGIETVENAKEQGKQKCGTKKLGPSTNHDGEKHGRELRRTKDITMDQLPSRFPLSVFIGLKFLVSSNIFVKRPDHTSSNDTSHEYNNHEGVDNGVIVNVIVKRSHKVNGPGICPGKIILNPLNIITVANLQGGFAIKPQGKVSARIIFYSHALARGDIGIFVHVTIWDCVVDTDQVDIKSSDAHTVELGKILMVGNGKLEVIIEEIFSLLLGWGGRSLESDRISTDSIV